MSDTQDGIVTSSAEQVADKHYVVEAVVDYQCATVLRLQARALAWVNDWQGLDRWAEAMVLIVEEHGALAPLSTTPGRRVLRH